MSTCIWCVAGFHDSCESPENDICCCPDEAVAFVGGRGPTKDNDAVRDVESTGRKRAAVAYPIEMECNVSGPNLDLLGAALIQSLDATVTSQQTVIMDPTNPRLITKGETYTESAPLVTIVGIPRTTNIMAIVLRTGDRLFLSRDLIRSTMEKHRPRLRIL